jgi:hypothetical protein
MLSESIAALSTDRDNIEGEVVAGDEVISESYIARLICTRS